LLYCGILVMFLTPLITMRLFAEERHRGTIEQLYTLPVRDWEMVAGKYGAAIGMVLALMAVIGVDLLVVAAYTTMEPLILAAGLVSVLLMGVAFMALGLFISALTRNQMTAATLTFGILLGLFFVSDRVGKMPEANAASASNDITRAAYAAYNAGREAVSRLAADAHVKDLALGVVKPQDVAFYLLFAALFLFLTLRVLEARFWRS
jgi:ABC-2 type transport system permease protein